MQQKMSFSLRILVLFLLSALTTASYRATGEQPLEITDAPFIVSLLLPSTLEFQCTGVIIGTKFILAAAHCFAENTNRGIGRVARRAQLYVRVGSEFWDSGGVVYSTTEVALAPRYGADFMYFDLAIARLNDTLRLSDRIGQISLPSYRAPIPPNSVGVAIGFGMSNEDDGVTYTGQLRAVQLSVWTYEYCDNILKNTLSKWYSPLQGKGTFCVGNEQDTTCLGDGGEAFVIDGVLYGIMSFGAKCGQTAYFTEVSQFEDMIDIFQKIHDFI